MKNNTFVLNDDFNQSIENRLSTFSRKSITDSALTQAAVAFTIVGAQNECPACFLLTRRAKSLKKHGGQYALPGGKVDKNESKVQAALRELEEEIGIQVSDKNVLGLLDDYSTRSGFNITPVVIWAGAIDKFSPNPLEVAKVYRIPINELNSPSIPYTENSADGKSQVLSVPIATLGHRVFAPTAAFIFQFREVVLFNRPTRVAHFDQPKFAWS